MVFVKQLLDIIFSLALFINAVLFIPQAIRMLREKTAKEVSLTTFLGFLLIQLAIVLHGVMIRDYLLVCGYVLSMLTCATVVLLILVYRNKKYEIPNFGVREILDQLPCHIYWKDREGIMLGSNKSNWEDFQTKSLNDFIGKSDYDLFDKEEADRLRLVDDEVMRTGFPKIAEEILTSRNGKTVYLSHKIPLRNKKNETIGILGISFDITEKIKETNKKLNILDNIIAVMPGNVYWLNKEGFYQGCNNNQAKLIGLSSRKEIVGKQNKDLPSFLIPEAMDPINQKVMESGQSLTIEESAVLSNGQEAIFLWNKMPLRDNEGNVIGMVGISQDVTEKNKSVDKAKSEFIANMSHDIRTPLTGIIGVAELLLKEVTTEKGKQAAEQLISASTQLLDFSNEILELFQIENGKLPMYNKPFSIKTVLERVIYLLEPSSKDRKLILTMEFDDNIPARLMGDPTRLHRIILNLASNAIKFTKMGSVTIGASIAKKNEDQCVVQFIVKDTGIGIPKSEQDIIFCRFSRLTSSYQNTYKGAGLGLAIVKQFIDDLNGEIFLDSEVNKGSCFSCIIPFKRTLLDDEKVYEDLSPTEEMNLNKVESPIIQELSEESPMMISSESLNGDRRILLVEDSKLVQIATKNKLEEWGCFVDVADTGEEALEKLENNIYDLVFMDIGLPGIDGCEVARKFRDHEKKNNRYKTPIIALTAHVDEPNKKRCLSSGMNTVLNKPLAENVGKEIIRIFIPPTSEQTNRYEKEQNNKQLLDMESQTITNFF